MSGLLDASTLVVEGKVLAIPLPVTPPLAKCFLDAGITTARGGPWLHDTLRRTIVVVEGRVPALALFTVDVRAFFPRGGRVWLTVRYADQLLATGPIQLLVP